MIDLDFTLQRGTFHARIQACLDAPVTVVTGRSGSGKSTLLAALAGLIPPQHGHILLDGTPLFDAARRINLPPWKRHVGLVFQQGQLFPHLTVRSNLLFGYQALSAAQRLFKPDHVIDVMQVGGLLERYPHTLSGGEQQRVALARAILYSPRLLLLDEPLSSLDDELKARILPLLVSIRDEFALPMIHVTHSTQEMHALAAPVWRMEGGSLLLQASASPHSARIMAGL